jgi:hypothetical protein
MKKNPESLEEDSEGAGSLGEKDKAKLAAIQVGLEAWEPDEWHAFLEHGVAKKTAPTETERTHLWPAIKKKPSIEKTDRKSVSRREQRKRAQTEARALKAGSSKGKVLAINKLAMQQQYKNELSQWRTELECAKRAYEVESDDDIKQERKKK